MRRSAIIAARDKAPSVDTASNINFVATAEFRPAPALNPKRNYSPPPSITRSFATAECEPSLLAYKV
jgi:hypothetical protein